MWIVAALFCVVLNTGAPVLCFPVFIQSFITEFGWTVTQISTAAARVGAGVWFSGPLIGC